MMQKCPNCGRPTARTIDWACQWCGYPLLSGSYQKLNKTFKQLQQERQIPEHEPVPEEEIEVEAEAELRSTPPTKPELRLKPPVKAASLPQEPPPQEEPAAVTDSQPEIVQEEEEIPPAPEIETAPPLIKPELMPEANDIPEVETRAVKPELLPETSPVPVQEDKPEVKIESIVPPPAPPAPIDIKALLEKTSFTAEELDLLFQADSAAAEAKFEGQTLTVSGAVDRVFVNDGLGIHYMILGSTQGNGIWNIRCTFESSYVSELKKLSPKQAVTIRGKYGGHGKNIILKDCIMPAAA